MMNPPRAQPGAGPSSADPPAPVGENSARRARWPRILAAWLADRTGSVRSRRSGEEIMVTGVVAQSPIHKANPHPNELDLRRIRRALADRRRYRYVEPRVTGTAGGYRIESPCCSRNVDPAGGVIDIARLEYGPRHRQWLLHYRDHRQQRWAMHGAFASLAAALAVLNEDPDRRFWP